MANGLLRNGDTFVRVLSGNEQLAGKLQSVWCVFLGRTVGNILRMEEVRIGGRTNVRKENTA